MLWQYRYRTLALLGLATVVFGCNRGTSQSAAQSGGDRPSVETSTNGTAKGIAESKAGGGALTENSTLAPAGDEQPNGTATSQTAKSLNAVSGNGSKSTVTTQVGPVAQPKPEIVRPTPEQLARWARTPYEPLQLLAYREWSQTGFINNLARLPNGRQFLLAGVKVTLWSIDGTEPEHVFLDLSNSTKEHSIKSLAVSPDGKWFAAGDSNGLLKVWTLEDRKEIMSKKIFTTGITQIAISPDGQELAMISYNVDIAIYDAATLEKKDEFKVTTNSLNRIHYLSPGQLAAAGETTTIWNTMTGKQEHILSPGRYNFTLARSSDGKLFAFGEKDDLQLWDIAQSTKAGKVFPNIATNELVDFSPDGLFLAMANGSNMRIWDIATQQVVQAIDVAGWPIIGLSWLPESRLLLVSTVNGWTRIWGTAKAGEPLGLRPLHVATAMPDSASRQPASTEQWHHAIDLSSFPRLVGGKPRMADSSNLDYVANVKIDEAKVFYQYHLMQAGWTPSETSALALSPGSAEYNKNGFRLSASFMAENDVKTSISLHNAGNYDLRWAPKFDGAPVEEVYADANTVMYRTKADVVQIETTLLQKLHQAGWTAFSRLTSSHNEVVDSRDFELLQNGTVLRVSIGKFPADPSSFHIQYSSTPIDHSLPIPKDSGFIEFDGHTQPLLVATTTMNLDQAREFYDKSMVADGWLIHDKGRNPKEDQNWLTYIRGQQDVLIGLVKQENGRTLIRVGERLENLSWQLEKPKPVADPKTVSASMEAADFPILNQSKSAKFDAIAKSIDVQVDATPMAEVADRYTKALQTLGWTIKGSGIRSDEYTFLTFSKEKVELDLRARPSNGNISVNFQGNGLIWTKPLPGGKQVISYETWLRQNRHTASLDLIETYRTEMKSIAGK